jgi:hypothetical protein
VHPVRFENITSNSSFEDFQCALVLGKRHYEEAEGACREFPCGVNCNGVDRDCRNVAGNASDPCYAHVHWAMTDGIHDLNPAVIHARYCEPLGKCLTPNSSFEEFQCNIMLQSKWSLAQSVCDYPCDYPACEAVAYASGRRMQEDVAVAYSSGCSGVLVLMLLLAMGLLGMIGYVFLKQKKKLNGTKAVTASLYIGGGKADQESNPVGGGYVPPLLSSRRWSGDYTAVPIVGSWNEEEAIRKNIMKRFGGMGNTLQSPMSKQYGFDPDSSKERYFLQTTRRRWPAFCRPHPSEMWSLRR